LATSAIVEDLSLLATSSVIADMASLAGSGANPNITTLTASGEIAAASLDISGNVDVDGTLEADAMTLNGTAITATATLDTGISNNNVPKFTSGVADDDFLRVAGTAIEGRSAAEVLSDIGASAVAGSSSIVTTGALNAGSITSGFGAIDNGSSAITTTGVGSFGSLDISGNIDVDGTTDLDTTNVVGAFTVTGDVTLNDGSPNLRLNDSDVSRFVDILYGTRVATFRNTMASGEDIDTVEPSMVFSFKDDGETRTAMTIDHDAGLTVAGVLTAGAGSVGMGPAFFAHPASAQSVSQATFTKIALGTEVYDTDSKFASDKFTPTIAGYYQINASVTFANATFTQAGAILQIRRNGSNYAGFNSVVGGFESRHGINGSALVYLDSDDYVEMWIYNTSSAVTIAHDTGETHFSGGMVRRA